MKIIAIEGLDKSGKHTQVELLDTFLSQQGFKVARSEFHRYDSPTGDLIRQWLSGEWDASQETIELIMTADKQAQQDWMAQLEGEGVDFLVLDRYTRSQQVYSHAQGVSPLWTGMLLQHVRKPDVEVFIDITPEESMKRKGKHNGGENDRYESDLALLTRVRGLYRQHIPLVVNGMQPREDVHQDLTDKLHVFLSSTVRS